MIVETVYSTVHLSCLYPLKVYLKKSVLRYTLLICTIWELAGKIHSLKSEVLYFFIFCDKKNGVSGFLRACSRGQLEIVQMLYKHCIASIASKDNVRIWILQYYLHHCPIPTSMQCGCNAAHYAADGGHLGVLCFLSKVGFKDFDQQSRVMQYCSLVFDVHYFSFCWEVWSIVTMHLLLFL